MIVYLTLGGFNGNNLLNVVGLSYRFGTGFKCPTCISKEAPSAAAARIINEKVNEQRAETVADLLTHKYGIDSSRLTVSGMEGEEQPFNTNDWNRVVIITAD